MMITLRSLVLLINTWVEVWNTYCVNFVYTFESGNICSLVFISTVCSHRLQWRSFLSLSLLLHTYIHTYRGVYVTERDLSIVCDETKVL